MKCKCGYEMELQHLCEQCGNRVSTGMDSTDLHNFRAALSFALCHMRARQMNWIANRIEEIQRGEGA